jgi:hypothetical protein
MPTTGSANVGARRVDRPVVDVPNGPPARTLPAGLLGGTRLGHPAMLLRQHRRPASRWQSLTAACFASH